MNKKRLNELKTIYEILLQYPETRENDMLLHFKYLELKGYSSTDKDLLIHPERFGIATFKTTERSRRKLQAIDRETGSYKIQSSSRMKKIREDLEKEFRNEYR